MEVWTWLAILALIIGIILIFIGVIWWLFDSDSWGWKLALIIIGIILVILGIVLFWYGKVN